MRGVSIVLRTREISREPRQPLYRLDSRTLPAGAGPQQVPIGGGDIQARQVVITKGTVGRSVGRHVVPLEDLAGG